MKKDYFLGFLKPTLMVLLFLGVGFTQLSAQSDINSKDRAIAWEMADKSNKDNSYSFVVSLADANNIVAQLDNDQGISAFFPATKFVGANRNEVKFLVQTKNAQFDVAYLEGMLTNSGMNVRVSKMNP